MRFIPLVIRLIIYFIAISAPFLSPSIVVFYDKAGFAFHFLLIPIQAVLAWLFAMKEFNWFHAAKKIFGMKISPERKILLIAFILPLIFSVIPGFGEMVIPAYLYTIAIFIFTFLVFNKGIVSLIFIEPCFTGIIFYRLLEFSRAGEEIRQDSFAVIPLFFLLLAVSYLFISIVLYSSSGKGNLKDFKREIILFFIVMAPLILAATLFIPADFLTGNYVLNFRDEKVLSGGSAGDDNGEGELSGIPSDKWGRRSRSSSGSGKQYAVMIVKSTEKDIYAASQYLGGFDKVKGIVTFKEIYGDTPPDIGYDKIDEESFNLLKNQRFLETWQYRFTNPDEYREKSPAFFMSALPDRIVPYLPILIEPTVYTSENYPFAYSYNSESLISPLKINMLPQFEAIPFTEEETEEFASYIDIPLSEKHKKIFENYLKELNIENLAYNEKILAIMNSFSQFQYELGFEDNTSVEKIASFASEKFPGDCTELSNLAAFLGRLSGIPSRIVLGYLASENLQSSKHIQALEILKESLPIIKDVPISELLLVTTAHRHSWVQYYVPQFGWVDFDATSFAIPPLMGDPNSADLVIPIIRGERKNPESYIFPWKVLLALILAILICIALTLYFYKAFLLCYLSVKSKKPTAISFESRYRYILHRFFLSGRTMKTRSMTPIEYGQKEKDFALFAQLFTELLYQENYSGRMREETLAIFDEEYKKLITLSLPKEFLGKIKAFFSMRGIFYR